MIRVRLGKTPTTPMALLIKLWEFKKFVPRNSYDSHTTKTRANTMAFDMPIDADRVDDLGLFSFFLRAPIVGTLMWILGGHEAKKQQEEEEKTRQKDDENYLKNTRPPPAQLQKMIESNQQKRRGIMKKTPRLVGSDISDFGDCAIQLNAAEMEHHFAFSTPKDDYDLKKNNKRMSWSDESGQDLVQYIGNDVSPQHSLTLITGLSCTKVCGYVSPFST